MHWIAERLSPKSPVGAPLTALRISHGDDFPGGLSSGRFGRFVRIGRKAGQLEGVLPAVIDRVTNPEIVFDPDSCKVVVDLNDRIPDGLLNRWPLPVRNAWNKGPHRNRANEWGAIRRERRDHQTAVHVDFGRHTGRVPLGECMEKPVNNGHDVCLRVRLGRGRRDRINHEGQENQNEQMWYRLNRIHGSMLIVRDDLKMGLQNETTETMTKSVGALFWCIILASHPQPSRMPPKTTAEPSAAFCAAIAFTVLLSVPTASAQTASGGDNGSPAALPTIEAVFVEEAPRIDGRLDDDAWQFIDPISDFRQRWPNEGALPTEETWAKVAYDRDYLYFAFSFKDKSPELIRAKNMERGGRNDRDDHAYIGLDTFLDGRNAYLFEMNALGTQDDAMIADEAITLDSYSWDAVFTSETVINEEGWTLEVSIPFRQLRFPEGEELEFGLFMRRKINRKNETLNWPLIPLSYGSGYSDDMRTVSEYGRLTGIKNISRGKNIELTPYVVSGAQKVRPDLSVDNTNSDLNNEVGFDLKYGLTSNITIDATVNTDFAQVEADNAQVNLTRFSLFFPEKRQFFLERSGLFEHGSSRQTQTFFSRRIGLTERILAGARATGQVGRVSVGLLNIETGDEMSDLLGSRSANNFVARARTEVRPRATAGAIFTSLDRGGDWNRAFGADTQVRFWSRSEFDAWYTGVVASDDTFDGEQAGRVSLSLRNAVYGGSLSYTSVSTDFNPGLGFVRRRDMRQSVGTLTWSPFLENGPFRQITAHTMGIYITGQDGDKQSWSINPSVGFQLRQRDSIQLTGSREFERLEQPFFIRPDAEIVPGDYTFNRVGLSFTSDPGRRLSLSAGLETGDFFHGTRTDWNASGGYRQSKYLTLGGSLRYSTVDLPISGGDFNATTASIDILGSVSRKLFAKALIQYDNFSRNATANIRIDWIHTPGSDLFLVFNTSYHVPSDSEDVFDPRADLLLNNMVGIAKLTYLIML